MFSERVHRPLVNMSASAPQLSLGRAVISAAETIEHVVGQIGRWDALSVGCSREFMPKVVDVFQQREEREVTMEDMKEAALRGEWLVLYKCGSKVVRVGEISFSCMFVRADAEFTMVSYVWGHETVGRFFDTEVSSRVNEVYQLFGDKPLWFDSLTHGGDSGLLKRTLEEMGRLYVSRKVLQYDAYKGFDAYMVAESRMWLWQECSVTDLSPTPVEDVRVKILIAARRGKPPSVVGRHATPALDQRDLWICDADDRLYDILWSLGYMVEPGVSYYACDDWHKPPKDRLGSLGAQISQAKDRDIKVESDTFNALFGVCVHLMGAQAYDEIKHAAGGDVFTEMSMLYNYLLRRAISGGFEFSASPSDKAGFCNPLRLPATGYGIYIENPDVECVLLRIAISTYYYFVYLLVLSFWSCSPLWACVFGGSRATALGYTLYSQASFVYTAFISRWNGGWSPGSTLRPWASGSVDAALVYLVIVSSYLIGVRDTLKSESGALLLDCQDASVRWLILLHSIILALAPAVVLIDKSLRWLRRKRALFRGRTYKYSYKQRPGYSRVIVTREAVVSHTEGYYFLHAGSGYKVYMTSWDMDNLLKHIVVGDDNSRPHGATEQSPIVATSGGPPLMPEVDSLCEASLAAAQSCMCSSVRPSREGADVVLSWPKGRLRIRGVPVFGSGVGEAKWRLTLREGDSPVLRVRRSGASLTLTRKMLRRVVELGQGGTAATVRPLLGCSKQRSRGRSNSGRPDEKLPRAEECNKRKMVVAGAAVMTGHCHLLGGGRTLSRPRTPEGSVSGGSLTAVRRPLEAGTPLAVTNRFAVTAIEEVVRRSGGVRGPGQAIAEAVTGEPCSTLRGGFLSVGNIYSKSKKYNEVGRVLATHPSVIRRLKSGTGASGSARTSASGVVALLLQSLAVTFRPVELLDSPPTTGNSGAHCPFEGKGVQALDRALVDTLYRSLLSVLSPSSTKLWSIGRRKVKARSKRRRG